MQWDGLHTNRASKYSKKELPDIIQGQIINEVRGTSITKQFDSYDIHEGLLMKGRLTFERKFGHLSAF